MDLSAFAISLSKIFMMIGIGFALARLKVIKHDGLQVIADIVMNLAMPFLVFHSIYSTYTLEVMRVSYKIILMGLLVPFLTFMVSFTVAHILHISIEKRSAFYILSVFANTTFIGLPVSIAMFGEQSIMPLMLYDLGHTMLFWTFGIWILSGDGMNEKGAWKRFLNPSTISLAISLIIAMLGWKLPKPLLDVFEIMGNITVPMAMIFIGANMAFIELKHEIDYILFPSAVIKLLVAPLLAIALLSFMKLTLMVSNVIIIAAAMPTMMSSAVILKQFGGNDKLASVTVLTTTLLCFISIPLIAILFRL